MWQYEFEEKGIKISQKTDWLLHRGFVQFTLKKIILSEVLFIYFVNAQYHYATVFKVSKKLIPPFLFFFPVKVYNSERIKDG